ncbi:MAG TPA: hypothetical protein VIU12_24285 [Chryseolinea sp.]
MLILIAFAGCDKKENDSNPVPVQVFTLSVGNKAAYVDGSLENWLIVHDEEGALVGYKRYDKGDEVQIETDKPLPGSTIAVTLLNYYNDGTERWGIESYLQIAIGEKFTLSNSLSSTSPDDDAGLMLGGFTVNVNGVGSIDELELTNKFGLSCGGGGSGSGIRINCTVRENAQKELLILSDANVGDVRYKMFENIKSNDVYNLSYADMSAFDKTYYFTFPSSDNVVLQVTGKEPDQTIGSGYLTNFHFNGDQHSQMPAGYLNSLTHYSTYFSASYQGYSYTYQNEGSIPEGEIQWPSPSDYNQSAKFVNNFVSSTAKPFNYRQSNWMYQSSESTPLKRVLWSVFGTSEKHAFSELPAEIVAKYPLLVFDGMTFTGTSFVSGTLSYSDIIQNKFGTPDPKPSTSVAITVW